LANNIEDPNKMIGNWPNKGALIHYHWAKLYLDSYVLRGLPEQNAIIPEHFLETASAAVQAALAIINILLEDRDAQLAVATVPHHIHGMIAFACMFLLKVAAKHSQQLFVDMARFQTLIGNLAQQFKTVDVGKDHLLHRMGEGLEKMADTIGGRPRHRRQKNVGQSRSELQHSHSNYSANDHVINGQSQLSGFDTMDASNPYDFGDPGLGLGMPFFDFEGTTLSAGDGLWNFGN